MLPAVFVPEAAPLLLLDCVCFWSLSQVNRAELQYSTQPMDNSGAASGTNTAGRKEAEPFV